MSKRNIILLIIAFITIVILGYVFVSITQQPNTNQQGSTENTNFLSNLLPFGKSRSQQTTVTNPANVSGYVPPNENTSTPAQQKLTKVSTMPVAGFGIFMKERFINLPVVTPTTTPPSTDSITPSTSSGQATTQTSKTSKKNKVKQIIPTGPPTEFVPAVKYVAKETGNIFESLADTISETILTSNMVPHVHDASFGTNDTSVLMRYLNKDGKTIETFIGTLPAEPLGGDGVGTQVLKGSFLPENITSISISPDTLKAFYLFNIGNNDSSVGIVANSLAGDKKVQIFNSPFTEWNSSWQNKNLITLTTKASNGIPGYAYAVDPDKKTFTKIFGNINGLTTLGSPDGKLILYSDDSLSLNVYNIATKNSVSLGLKTLPEKCAWGKLSDTVYCAVPNFIDGSGYPDAWYQGQVSFSDDIWKVDAINGNATMLSDMISQGQYIDGIKLALDPTETIFHKQKRFLSLEDGFKIETKKTIG